MIIAHRLAAIKDCDKIIVLKHGFVAEVGKHEELMNLRDGTYRRIWDEQERMVKDEMEEALLGTKSPNKVYSPPRGRGWWGARRRRRGIPRRRCAARPPARD